MVISSARLVACFNLSHGRMLLLRHMQMFYNKGSDEIFGRLKSTKTFEFI